MTDSVAGRSQPASAGSVQVRMLRAEQDIEATWHLSLALHRESRYAKLRMDKTKRNDYLRENMLGKPDRFGMLIAEWRGRPVGYLACAANRFLYGDEIITSCLAFYVQPAFRKTLLGGRIAVKLLDAYRRWAANRRAVEIQFHVTSGIDIAATDRFLRRAGFRQSGGNYALGLLPQTAAGNDASQRQINRYHSRLKFARNRTIEARASMDSNCKETQR